MTVTVTIKVDDLTPAVQQFLKKTAGAGKRVILEAMGEEFKGITLEQFGADRQNRAKPWAPLSPAYQKRIKYSGPPKLILSGDLQQSFTMSVGSDEVTVTANEPYATAQQFGRANMPDRPFFPVVDGRLTDYAQKRIIDAGERALVGPSAAVVRRAKP